MYLSRVIICALCLMFFHGHAAAAEKEYQKLYKQGVEANKKGDLDDAIRWYSKAITLKADAAGLYFVRGRAYKQKGAYDYATADFTRAIGLKPGYAEAYNQRGVTYIGKGMEKNALADFKKSCELGSRDGCANAQKLGKTGR